MRKRIDHDKSDGLTLSLFSPDSRWVAPSSYPDLSGEKTLGIDTETRDPYLTQKGPGFLRGDAEIVGISLATLDRAWYFPIRHLGGGNLNPENTIRYLRDLCAVDRSWVGANLQYDLESLNSLGVIPQGKFIDVQLAEALLDEEKETYTLESLATQYLGKGKDESLLREAASAYGLDPKSSMWKLPAKYVGPYAEWDAQAPLHIFREQLKALEREDLLPVFQLESELLPLLFLMRKQGIPVDLEAAKTLSDQLKVQEDELRFNFKSVYRHELDEWSGPQIAALCDQHRILYPRTTIGNPSFTADYLEEADHPLLEAVHQIRQVNRFRQTFVNDWIMKWQVKGRIHPQWRQVARDDGGTRTGRMAASSPNPQQVPAGKFRKTGKPSPVGKAIRACFVADEGAQWWKGDYSQQEPRILTHFAAITEMTGAALAKMAYQMNPEMDFYQYMVDAAGIDRRPAKDMYLGRCYGMGVKKMARKLNRTEDEARQILATFDERVPFVKELADKCTAVAERRGYIKTLLGRRRHFNTWEPGQWDPTAKPMRRGLAEKQWPGQQLRRSNTHKALNALIQGSAADMSKAAMLRIWKEWKIIPYISMHDEIGAPVRSPEEEAGIKLCCEESVTMCVPMRVDAETGRSWK